MVIEWISVKDRLPEEKINQVTVDYQDQVTMDYQQVLCYCDFGKWQDICTCGYGNGHFWNGGGIVDEYVTHWMPFP